MEKINDGGSAFPEIITTPAWENNGGPGYTVYGNTYSQGGMSKRDYFAAMAMQGMLAKAGTWTAEAFISMASRSAKKGGESLEEVVAVWAYEFADAMLKAGEAANERT